MGKRKIPLNQHLIIVGLYQGGKSSTEIATTYNVNSETILTILKKHNIVRRPSNNVKPAHTKTKICTKCHKRLLNDLKHFALKGKKYKDGQEKLRSRCKNCVKEYATIYTATHKGALRSYALRHYYKNRERNLIRGRKYRMSHKKEILASQRIYVRQRKASDVNYKMRHILANRIRNLLKSQGVKKTMGTIELIGCSMIFLKKHIESQFDDKMTWKNYGRYGWHVHHIIPCALFDLSKIEEQRKCFHYSNLKPLWFDDNLDQSSIYNGVRITYKNRHLYKL